MVKKALAMGADRSDRDALGRTPISRLVSRPTVDAVQGVKLLYTKDVDLSQLRTCMRQSCRATSADVAPLSLVVGQTFLMTTATPSSITSSAMRTSTFSSSS